MVPAFAGGLDNRPAVDAFFMRDGRACIDALVSLTGFSLVGGPAYNDAAGAQALLADLDVRIGEVRGRLPAAEQTLAGLRARYPAESLATVRTNIDQATRLLEAAAQLVATGRGQVETDRAAAVASARSAEDAVQQAARLVDAVDRAGSDLDNARALLDQRQLDAVLPEADGAGEVVLYGRISGTITVRRVP